MVAWLLAESQLPLSSKRARDFLAWRRARLRSLAASIAACERLGTLSDRLLGGADGPGAASAAAAVVAGAASSKGA